MNFQAKRGQRGPSFVGGALVARRCGALGPLARVADGRPAVGRLVAPSGTAVGARGVSRLGKPGASRTRNRLSPAPPRRADGLRLGVFGSSARLRSNGAPQSALGWCAAWRTGVFVARARAIASRCASGHRTSTGAPACRCEARFKKPATSSFASSVAIRFSSRPSRWSSPTQPSSCVPKA